MKKYSESEIKQQIKKRVSEGTFTKVGEEVGVTPGFLHDLVNDRRSLTKEVASKFGFDRHEEVWFTLRGK